MTWNERIKAARDRGYFTLEDKGLARTWTTCACGEQDPRIPRRPESDVLTDDGMPYDPILVELGGQFFDYVDGNLFDKAELCLVEIEQRATEIIQKLPK